MKQILGAFFLTTVIIQPILIQPILAQTLIDGSDIGEIINIAKGYGSATLERSDEGEPAIRGRIDGKPYFLSFRNCSGENSCEDFFIQSYILKPVVNYELSNKWNFEKRWTKVYYDADDDLVLEMDFNLDNGVTLANLEQAFSLWSQFLEQFHDDYFAKKDK